jgi:hypothetical protein
MLGLELAGDGCSLSTGGILAFAPGPLAVKVALQLLFLVVVVSVGDLFFQTFLRRPKNLKNAEESSIAK